MIDDYKENLENLERIKSENRKQIENLLATYSKEKMLHILLEIADKNIDVRDRLLKEIELRTNEKLDEKEFLKKYNKKIDDLFLEYEELEEEAIEYYENGYSYNRDYWDDCDDDYVDTDKLENEISEVFSDIDGLLNDLDCLKLSMKILEGIDNLHKKTETTYYQSAWKIGMDYFKEKLANVGNLSNTTRLEIFNRINKLNVEVADEYKIAVDTGLLVQFCDLPGVKEVLLSKLNFANKGYRDEDINNRIAEIMYNIYKKTNDKEGLEKSLKALLQYESIRDIYINKLEKNNNLEAILEETKPWSEQGKYRKKWLEYRLQIFRTSNNMEEQIKVLESLVLLGEFSYYESLKNIYKENFDKYYQKLLRKAKKKQEIWCEIIVLENDVDEMLDYLRQYSDEITEYASIIRDKYFEEARNMYMNYIFDISEPVADRSHYRKICSHIVKYKNLFGLEEGIALVDYLDDKYKKRRAFREELRGILGGYK